MAKSEEQVRLLLKRIKDNNMVDGDGQAFIDYLETLSKENYLAWLSHGPDKDQMHKGYALCVDSLLESFATCSKRKPKPKGNEGAAHF